MEALVVSLHIIGGSLAIVSGYAALFARKGKRLHRRAGTLFVYAMIAMGLGATLLGLIRGKSSWIGGPTVAYFVVTALVTVRQEAQPARRRDSLLMAVALLIGVLTIIGGFEAAANPDPRIFTPVIFMNGGLLLLAAAGDARVIRYGPLRGNRRLARHLWRMCFAMFTATGSFFFGQTRVIPKPLRIGPMLTILAVLPLVMLFYWMWRVRRSARPIVVAAQTA